MTDLRSIPGLAARRRLGAATALASATVLTIAACGGSFGANDIAGVSVSHSDYFVVTGSHQSLTCNDCHDPAAPSFTVKLNGVSCLASNCHASADVTPKHAGVPGFAYDTATCIGCHKTGDASALPPNHDANDFPVTNTKHAGVACRQCHGPTRSVADLQCAPCHDQATMATKHAAIPATTRGSRSGATYTNYSWASTFCVKCHADGQVNRIAAHPALPRGQLIQQGHTPFCLTCHQDARTDTKTWGVNFKTFTCLACHTDNNGGGTN